MNADPLPSDPDACADICLPTPSVETLNRDCFCVAIDRRVLHDELEATLGDHGLPEALAQSHPHLFSMLPVYVSRSHLEQIANAVAAIERVSATPVYQSTVLSWAPTIAAFDPGSPGGLLGLDFHLGPEGPRLIEINTNPGGALLNAVHAQAVRACMPGLTTPPTDAGPSEAAVFEAMLTEWRLQRGAAALAFVAIVDAAPAQQYLYPEFLLYRQLFRRHGYRAEICSPQDLVRNQGRLWLGENPVDLIYNRLTDFSLQEAAHEHLRAAYRAAEVVLSPHPRAHALYADKRNLSVLGNRDFLLTTGAPEACVVVLAAAIPPTQLVTPENRESMWALRRGLFFKPAAGFGSKASYRGDKLTRKVWDEIARGTYVAQQIVAPSERHLKTDADPLKVDIRCYAYRGKVLLYAARMYQGQTTNFRTSGGGFASILTTRDTR